MLHTRQRASACAEPLDKTPPDAGGPDRFRPAAQCRRHGPFCIESAIHPQQLHQTRRHQRRHQHQRHAHRYFHAHQHPTHPPASPRFARQPRLAVQHLLRSRPRYHPRRSRPRQQRRQPRQQQRASCPCPVQMQFSAEVQRPPAGSAASPAQSPSPAACPDRSPAPPAPQSRAAPCAASPRGWRPAPRPPPSVAAAPPPAPAAGSQCSRTPPAAKPPTAPSRISSGLRPVPTRSSCSGVTTADKVAFESAGRLAEIMCCSAFSLRIRLRRAHARLQPRQPKVIQVPHRLFPLVFRKRHRDQRPQRRLLRRFAGRIRFRRRHVERCRHHPHDRVRKPIQLHRPPHHPRSPPNCSRHRSQVSTTTRSCPACPSEQ